MTSTTGEFAWETSNIQQEHFAALTFLLSGRRGCQIEPSRTEDGANPKMEENFLDRLAEFLTVRPEPRFITGTALRRTADGHIEVVVARNNCLNEPGDARFFKKVKNWIQSDESPTKGTSLIPAQVAVFIICIRRCLLERDTFLLQLSYRGGQVWCRANREAA